MAEFLFACLLVVGLLICLSSVDDLFVDLLRLKVRRPGASDDTGRADAGGRRPEIAVLVANWHEANVLGPMVEGNLARIGYRPLRFVLGVYPNDPETRRVAEELALKHPGTVEVVINTRAGPTSKGQMLNAMFRHVFSERENAPDIAVLHDSEDVIDPRSLELYAARSAEFAFIQIPVFSLDSRQRSLVGATYMDEFAERHTGEMLVRNDLGSFIPSAGVGTAIRRDLVEHFIRQRGYVLDPGSVTEDYMLGVESHRAGFRSTFALVEPPSPGGAEPIATLEYFPRELWASVRQKTRWVHGIVFEGTQRLGWSGSAWDRYFLWRDRKGAITNLLPIASILLALPLLFLGNPIRELPAAMMTLAFVVLGCNTGALAVRFLIKMVAFRRVYGSYDPAGIAIRWLLAIVINAAAVGRAWRTFLVESRLASRPVAWAKTTHELPASFSQVGLGPARPHPVIMPASGVRLSRMRHFGTASAVANAAAILLVIGAIPFLHMTSSVAQQEVTVLGAASLVEEIVETTDQRHSADLPQPDPDRELLQFDLTRMLADRRRRDAELIHQAQTVLAEAAGTSQSGEGDLPGLSADSWLAARIDAEERLHIERYLAQELAERRARVADVLQRAADRAREAPSQTDAERDRPVDVAALVTSALRQRSTADRQILQQAESVRTQIPSVSDVSMIAVRELEQLRIITRRKRQLASSHSHNARILSRIAPLPSGASKPGPRIVAAAQAAANRWLAARDMGLHDVGVPAKASACNPLLCEDGILGRLTKQTLIGIASRDGTFWKPRAQASAARSSAAALMITNAR